MSLMSNGGHAVIATRRLGASGAAENETPRGTESPWRRNFLLDHRGVRQQPTLKGTKGARVSGPHAPKE